MKMTGVFAAASTAVLAAMTLSGCQQPEGTQGAAPSAAAAPAQPDEHALVERGRYLVSVIGCGDCHTPGALMGRPDMAHPLTGTDVGFEVPGLGVFYGPNLTPHPDAGLGRWSRAQIVAAFTRGQRPDGRELAPVMPWRNFANMTPTDAQSVAAYLQSLPPSDHRAPAPTTAERATAAYETIRVPGR